MEYSDEDFNLRAKRFLSRTPGDHTHEQTVQFISEIYKLEYRLIELEKEIDNIRPGLRGRKLENINDELSELSEDFKQIQRVITSPEDCLHEAIDIGYNDVDNKATSEILTQLGWEWFPRELDRLYSVQERVYRKADAKSQQMLTNRIVFFSFLALIVSVLALLTRFI